MSGPLTGVRVFDLTRVLAGPSCTQLLGDLGADVVKIERPGLGDDTRKWGPPYAAGVDGRDTAESAYYLSANRNKRSLTLDLTKPAGQALARRLIARSDVLIENFKVGDLARHGLDYPSLKESFPNLIYCSITGFGQTGPYAARAGYDYLAQALGGVMSVTGPADGVPTRIGVAIADLLTGLYAANAVMAALYHRARGGAGQHIDLSLLDAQIAGLANVGQYVLTSGENPPRLGNGHSTIVPYDTYRSADGWLVLAVGNDSQFGKFCDFAGRPDLARDTRFKTNDARVRHRAEITPILQGILERQPTRHWVDGLAGLGVPVCPINTIAETFADPQVRHRGMEIALAHALTAEPVRLIGSPIKLSETPVSYRHAPPVLGQHTDEVLREILDLSDAEIGTLRKEGAI